MKKFISILLLLVLIYNWLGYRLVYNYFEHKANQKLELSLDQNRYNSKELIEIKIPLNLPYYSNNSEFTRYDGEIEIKGVNYKYVKRRIYNDTLTILCLQDNVRQKIQKEKDNFFKLVNGLQQQGKSKEKNNAFFKTLISEYKEEQNNWKINSWFSSAQQFHTKSFYFNSICYLSKTDKPPEYFLL